MLQSMPSMIALSFDEHSTCHFILFFQVEDLHDVLELFGCDVDGLIRVCFTCDLMDDTFLWTL
jgi:hypothetical protein